MRQSDDSPSATLTLSEWYCAEVPRARADLHFNVDFWGLGRPSGRRVERLRAALSAASVPADHVSVEALSHESWAPVLLVPLGLLIVPLYFVRGADVAGQGVAALIALALLLALLGTPSGSTSLRVRCPDPESVRRALDRAIQLPGVALRAIAWAPSAEGGEATATDAAALQWLRARAEALASQQGMRVLSLRRLELSAEAPASPAPALDAPVPASRRSRASFSAQTLGAEPGTQRTQVFVRADFVLAPA